MKCKSAIASVGLLAVLVTESFAEKQSLSDRSKLDLAVLEFDD